LALWASGGMWALVQLVASRQSPVVSQKAKLARWGLVLALINAAGLYTQYAYPFIMLAQGVIFLLWFASTFLRRRSSTQHSALSTQHFSILGTYIASNVLTILIFLPWLPTALRQVTQWPSTGTPIPAAEALGIIGGWFTLGITYQFVPNAVNYLPFALLILSGGIVGLLWQRRKTVIWPLLVPILWAGLPVALFLALGLFRPANLKFLLPAQIGFALLMGAAFGGWWTVVRRGYHLDRITLILTLLQAGWLLVYLSNGLQPLYTDSHFQRADYRGMVQAITAHPRPGDAIILDAPNQEEVFRYYYRGDAPVYPLPTGLGGDDAQTLVDVQKVIRQSKRIFVLFWGESERDPHHIVEDTLNSAAFEAGQDIWYGDVRFAEYVTPVTMPDSKPVHRLFGDSIMLERAAVSGRVFRPGDVVQIRLEWTTDAPLNKRYKVFVQLLDAGGVLVAQRDSEPVGGSQPTTTWQHGITINDQHGLSLPSNLTPGNYQMIVGLYDPDDPNQRLPVAGKTYVTLGYIAVISSTS
jgi:hypothetical protein